MTATTFEKSKAMALKLGNAAHALFCTFEVSTKGGGLIKKPIQRGGKPGVPAVVSDEALFTADDIYSMEAIKHGQYFGLNMNKSIYVEGRGHLVCLDVDMKHKPEDGAVHSAIERLVGWVEKVGALNELSVSGKGHHVFVFAQTADNILRKYTLAQGQEVEIFGLTTSDKKSILLTGEAMEGEVIEVDDLEALLIELGIAQQKIASESATPKPSRNLDYFNLAPLPAPRANQEAFRAPLQAPARQNVKYPHETHLKAVEALRFLDPNLSEPDWWKVCVALQNEFGENGREMWNEWSSKSPKYKGRAETDYKFDRATPGGGVGIGTLFYLAKEGGYQRPDGFSLQSVQADFSGVTIDNETREMMKPHPLAVFVDCEGKAKPPRWTIPGFIGHGVTVISGAQGVGKTTAILPLAMTAAGLHGDELKPIHWRHVVYVTEDIEQAKRILAGMKFDGNLGIEQGAVKERLHMVEAMRLEPAFVASVGTTYREKFTRTVDGVEILPLVVLDTKSAVLAIENENDNSEASLMMAALKQGFDRLPVWLIGHLAKAILNNTDGLTSRGAGAIEGDANQTLFLIKDGEKRFLKQGKTRFEPKWQELEISSHTRETMEIDEFGNPETVMLRWGIAAPALTNRKEVKEQAVEAQRKSNDASLRIEIMDAVSTSSNLGNPIGRTGLSVVIKRKKSATVATTEQLLTERWLIEIFVPAKERLHPRKSSFFICLSTHEHDLLLAGTGLPQERLAIPASWKKAPIPVLGANGHDCPKSEVKEQA